MQSCSFRRAALLASIAGSMLGAAACSDPFQPIAQLDTFSDTLVVFGYTASPVSLPSAINLSGPSAVRVETRTDLVPGVGPVTSPTFDVGVDLNAAGQVVLYPSPLLLSPSVAARRVGFRKVDTPFDSLRRAPTGGFRYDSAFVVAVGEVVSIEAQSGGCSITAPLRAKLVVDSVSRPNNAVFVRVLTNPNCGFRSLLPGRPAS